MFARCAPKTFEMVFRFKGWIRSYSSWGLRGQKGLISQACEKAPKRSKWSKARNDQRYKLSNMSDGFKGSKGGQGI